MKLTTQVRLEYLYTKGNHMRYGISKYPNFIEIDEHEYLQIKSATKNLFEVFFLEEKLDIVTGNFYEYETELLSAASRMMIYSDENYFSMSDDRIAIGRRVANLVSSCRMYLDQCVHHITNIYGENSEFVAEVKKEKSNQYDNFLGYRIMETFRNYIQHRGAPVHSVRFSYNKTGTDEQIRLLHTAVPFIKLWAIDDEKFKKSILEEMKEIAIKDEIDIRPLIREYVEGIGKIQEKIRELIKVDTEKWESVLESTISKLKKELGGDETISTLDIVIELEENKWVESHTIFREFIERRRILENKNRFFNNLTKCFVTNEVRK